MSDLKCCGESERYVDGTSCCKGPVEKRHMNTRYVDEESNWVVACDSHFEEIEAYWDERWADYWSGCL